MPYEFLDIATTPSVRAAQQAMGSDRIYRNFKGDRAFNGLTPNETAFIAARDSLYIATVSQTGWPYVQHRGGPQGFVKVVDDKTLAFPDYRGNRQYISVGNLAANNRAAMILVDYAARARLKIYAHISTVPADNDLAELMAEPGGKARLERIFLVHLAAFDWNCPQHITPRFTEAGIRARTQLNGSHPKAAEKPLSQRLSQLEAENEALRARLADKTGE